MAETEETSETSEGQVERGNYRNVPQACHMLVTDYYKKSRTYKEISDTKNKIMAKLKSEAEQRTKRKHRLGSPLEYLGLETLYDPIGSMSDVMSDLGGEVMELFKDVDNPNIKDFDDSLRKVQDEMQQISTDLAACIRKHSKEQKEKKEIEEDKKSEERQKRKDKAKADCLKEAEKCGGCYEWNEETGRCDEKLVELPKKELTLTENVPPPKLKQSTPPTSGNPGINHPK